jgi:hypothetical protein
MTCVQLSRLFGVANCLRSLFIQNVCLYFAGESNVDGSQISFWGVSADQVPGKSPNRTSAPSAFAVDSTSTVSAFER